MFVLPMTSNAAVITHESDIDLSVLNDGGVLSAQLDVDGDTHPDFLFSAWDVLVDAEDGIYTRGTLIEPFGSNAIVTSVKESAFASALNSGDFIGPTSDLASSKQKLLKNVGNDFANINLGFWPNDLTQTRVVGLQFDIGGSTHYGWAEVGVQLGSANLIVGQVAYENIADTPIAVSGVPEPSSMALMLAGAAGVAALKRRRARAS
jgi:hypothetical protein